MATAWQQWLERWLRRNPPPVPVPIPTPQPAPTTGKLLIKHGQDRPNAEFLASNIRTMEKLPFDGVVFGINSSPMIQRQTPISQEEIAVQLSALANMTSATLRHNWLIVYSTPAGQLTDSWGSVIQNYRNLAAACAESGKVEGIFFDIEEYFGAALRYPENARVHKYLCQCLTVAQAQSQAFDKGYRIAAAMLQAWPTMKFMSTFGPWLSDPLTASNLPGVPYNDVAWANQLSGYFLMGMIKVFSTSPGSQFVDGGEIYTPRTAAQFRTVKSWQQWGMASKSQIVPADLRATYGATVSAAFGVYDSTWIGAAMDSAIWTPTLRNALAVADRYVWAYTEQHDWWGCAPHKPPVPQAWIDATRAARTTNITGLRR